MAPHEKPLSTSRYGEITVISLGDDAKAAVTPDLRRALSAALSDAADARAVVIAGGLACFSVGTNLGAVDQLAEAPSLEELCQQIENHQAPVIAALTGPALSSGAELAIACHYRVAAEAGCIALTDIAVALPPRAGTVQRLARLVGLESAADLVLTGRAVSPREAITLGLIDADVPGHAEAAAVSFAKAMLAEQLGPRPAAAERGALSIGPAALDQIAMIRGALPSGAMRASHEVVDCLEAAVLLPYGAAQLRELDAWTQCRRDPDSRALIHVLLAERHISPELMVRGDRGWHMADGGKALLLRLRDALEHAGQALRDHGASAQDVDAAAAAWGLPVGPFGTAPAGGDVALGERLIGALAAEGARMLDAGQVHSAGDLDVVAIYGMGLPRRTGGPMHLLEEQGMAAALAKLRSWGKVDPIWQPSPVVAQAMINHGSWDGITR